MLNSSCKSKCYSNTHQIVPHSSPVFLETLRFLDVLYLGCGTHPRIRYFSCCNTWAVWNEKRGYPYHEADSLMLNYSPDDSNPPTQHKTIAILQHYGWATATTVCVPGIDLEHTDYAALLNFKSLSTCNHKPNEPGPSTTPHSLQLYRPKQPTVTGTRRTVG